MRYQRPSYKLLYPSLALLLILSFIRTGAQNVTSPYSILGIGDIDTKDYGRYFSTGSTSIGRRDAASYNFANPASLTSIPLKTFNFDIATRGRFSMFQNPGTDTSTATSKDFSVERIAIAFKVTKNTAFAFGFKPYSNVNYESQYSQAIVNGISLNKTVDGSGGINQVYFSIAKELGRDKWDSVAKAIKPRHISVGLTASYLFGSIKELTEYTSTAFLPIDVSREVDNFLYGANLQAGIQYYSAANKKWRHQFGLTITAGSALHGQTTTEERDSSTETSISKTIYDATEFKLPSVVIGFGYSATVNNKWILSLDANYYKWPSQTVEYSQNNDFPDFHTSEALRVSGGIEYSKRVRYLGYPDLVEKYYVGIGASAENSYMVVNNTYLMDYSVSLGGGYNASKHFSIYGGIESGVKGNLNDNQIRETYVNFLVGVTLKDLWYGSKKFGKFY